MKKKVLLLMLSVFFVRVCHSEELLLHIPFSSASQPNQIAEITDLAKTQTLQVGGKSNLWSKDDEIGKYIKTFDGETDYILIQNHLNVNRIDFSFKTVSDNGFFIYSGQKNGSAQYDNYRFGIHILKSGHLQAVVGNGRGKGFVTLKSSLPVNTGKWTKLSLCYTPNNSVGSVGGKLEFLINGQLDDQKDYNQPELPSADYFVVGAVFDDYKDSLNKQNKLKTNPYGGFFKGSIIDLKVYGGKTGDIAMEQGQGRVLAIGPFPNSSLPLGGDRMGIPELWWWQLAKAFSINADLKVHDQSCSVFYMDAQKKDENKNAYFGILLPWSTIKFEKSVLYEWNMYVPKESDFPDFITINDRVVWRSTQGYFEGKHIKFEYVPKIDESIMVRLFWDLKDVKVRHIAPTHDWGKDNRSLICYKTGKTAKATEYETFFLPQDAVVFGIEPWRGSKNIAEAEEGVPFLTRPLLPMPYKVDDITFLERLAPRPQDVNSINFKQYTGIDTVTYQPAPALNPISVSFVPWADYLIKSGFKNLMVTPIVTPEWAKDKESGKYDFVHMHNPKGFNNKKLTAENIATVMSQWRQKVPDAKLYVFYPEINGMFGTYRGGINDTSVLQVDGYQNARDSQEAAWNTTFKYFKDFTKEVKKLVDSNAVEVRTVANPDDVGFQAAYAYKAGIDIVLNKCIHRQSINVAVANSRGAARAYGKEYGYDFDAWDRNWWGGHVPEGIKHGLLAYFHAGGKYLMDEIEIWSPTYGKPTAWGKAWFDFCRYACRHPQRGQQKVKIGIYRAFGDEWDRIASPDSAWATVPQLPMTEINKACLQPVVPYKWMRAANIRKNGAVSNRELIRNTYLWDYDLMNVVFADFGNPYETGINNFCTGTPYGPVDFIPWDIPQDKLNEYSIVVHLGRGIGTDRDTIKRLENYVQQGGILVLTAGQLRDARGQMCAAELCNIGLQDTKFLDKTPYTVLKPNKSAVILNRLTNGDPLVIKSKFGQGTAFVFCGEWLNDRDEVFVTKLLQKEISQRSWLEFEPKSNWLEYSVSERDGIWFIALLNHGRGLYPSGNGKDHGIWKGKLVVDLANLNLTQKNVEVGELIYDDSKDVPFRYNKMSSLIVDGKLAISTDLDEFREIVLGSSGQVEAKLFKKE